MKIETNPVRITGKFPADLLKNLKEGNILPVKIMERLGNNHAVLDINGKKINAEFLQGVPNTGKLFLILESRTDSILYFRIAGALTDDSIPELKRSIILTQTDLYKALHNPKFTLKDGMGLFELNKALLAFAGLIKKSNINTAGISDGYSDKLLASGVTREAILLINALIYNSPGRTFQIYQILSRIFPEFKYLNNINNADQINELIGDFINSIDGMDNDDIQKILDMLVKYPDNKEKQYGKIVYFDDNRFKDCEYIVYENNIILSLELSSVGGMDILIRKEKSLYSIFFYCENKDGQAALKKEIPALESALSGLPEKNFNILFFNNKKAVEKIIEIISAIDINYLLDIIA